MIISIRGTHGSGKSTIIKQLLDRYFAVPITDPTGGKKPWGYSMPGSQAVNSYHLDKPLFVVGPYTTSCGGCDAIQPYSLIWPRVVEFAKRGHVLFEGALVSSSYGNIGRNSEVYGEDFVFAFLNTPLNVCLDRIRKRRAAKGNDKPLDPKNTTTKYNNIEKSIAKIKSEFGRRVFILDYRKPVPQLLGLLKNG